MFVREKKFLTFVKWAEDRIDALTTRLENAEDQIAFLENTLGAKAEYQYGPYQRRRVRNYEEISVLARLNALPYKFEIVPETKAKVIATAIPEESVDKPATS